LGRFSQGYTLCCYRAPFQGFSQGCTLFC